MHDVTGQKGVYLKQEGQKKSEKLIFTRSDFLKTLQHPREELVSVQHAILNTDKQTRANANYSVQRVAAQKLNRFS